jgi:hypothetical protein
MDEDDNADAHGEQDQQDQEVSPAVSGRLFGRAPWGAILAVARRLAVLHEPIRTRAASGELEIADLLIPAELSGVRGRAFGERSAFGGPFAGRSVGHLIRSANGSRPIRNGSLSGPYIKGLRLS